MIGRDVAQEYLCYVLQTTATGLLKGQSTALIRDQVRAELFNNFRSAEQRLLADASRHAAIVVQLASGLRTALRLAAARETAKRVAGKAGRNPRGRNRQGNSSDGSAHSRDRGVSAASGGRR